jgi:predicted DNA-binding transcriptional regulator AlpA
MAITYIQVTAPAKPKAKRQRSALPPVDLDKSGRMRVRDVLAALRIGRTTLWDGIKAGTLPKPDYYRGRIPYWKTATISKEVDGGK